MPLCISGLPKSQALRKLKCHLVVANLLFFLFLRKEIILVTHVKGLRIIILVLIRKKLNKQKISNYS